MNILVLGNGFDLAHGLPTSYINFLEFCEKVIPIYNGIDKLYISYKSNFLSDWKINNEIKDFLEDAYKSRKKENNIIYTKYPELDELYLLIENNIWFYYFKKCNKHGKENWIDFENEISKVIKKAGGNLLVNQKLFDVYTNQILGNKKSVAYSLTFGSNSKTLTDEEIKSKEQEIIDFADIGEHLSQPVKTYSSGMFARLAFACAINVDPDILIVDEVLSVGDMAFQLKCFKKFEQFKEKGKTIIFVTHNVNDVLTNCNRAIILENGRKTFDGSVKDGVNRYKKIIVGINPDEEIAETENKDERKDNNIKEKKLEKHFQ